MKTKLLTLLGLLLLLTLGLAAGGLDQVATSANNFKDTLTTLAKAMAVIGLLFLVIRYFTKSAEVRTIPWGWIVAAIILGSIDEILPMFGIE